MPSVTEIRTRTLLNPAAEAKATAAANLVTANAAADDSYSAIVAAVKSGGHTDFSIDGSYVSVPACLRNWSAASGVSCPSRVSIGLESLVAAFNSANATATRRRNEMDGLVYLISSANVILCQDVDYTAPTTEADLNALLAMLSAIQASVNS